MNALLTAPEGPVVFVIPCARDFAREDHFPTVTLEGHDGPVQVEPWTFEHDGRVTSYRCTAYLDEGVEGAELTLGAPGSEPTLGAMSAAMVELSQAYLSLGGEHVVDMFELVRHIQVGPVSTRVRLAGDVGDFSVSGYAEAFAENDVAYVRLLVHNGDWSRAHKDLVISSEPVIHGPSGSFHGDVQTGGVCEGEVLPLMGARVLEFIYRVGPIGMGPEIGTVSGWDTVACSYLPQQIAVSAPEGAVDAQEEDLRVAMSQGLAVDYVSQPKVDCFQAEGATYGAMGSSFGVERWGEIGLALYAYKGHAGALEDLFALTVARHTAVLLDHKGQGMKAEDVMDSEGCLEVDLFVTPEPRSWDGTWGPVRHFGPNGDPFGYRDAPALHHPEGHPVWGYGAYDWQHGMRAMRAALPLAYVCGDVLARDWIHMLARMARLEQYEGNGGRLGDLGVTEPAGKGLDVGRGLAWCAQAILASADFSPARREEFGEWIACFQGTLSMGQRESGILQSRRYGKEVTEWGSDVTICQPYQEDLLLWALAGLRDVEAGGMISRSAMGLLAPASDQSTIPSKGLWYKIGVEALREGVDPSEYHSDHVSNAFIPALWAVMCWNCPEDAGVRAALLGWCMEILGGLMLDDDSSPEHLREYAGVAGTLAVLDRIGGNG